MLDFEKVLLIRRAQLRRVLASHADAQPRTEGLGRLWSLEGHRRFLDVDPEPGEQRLAPWVASELAAVERALDRFHSGSYGLCVECRDLMALTQLERRPWAEVCDECAQHTPPE